VKSHARRLLQVAWVLLLMGLAGGCATANIKPWDRDLLAQPKMSYSPLPLESDVDEHIYFSKEGSTGGQSVGGGGCGCN
jgi:hypothetical protein